MKQLVLSLLTCVLLAAPAEAQFRRGILGDAREVTLFPVEPPAMLLPSNATLEVVVRNTSAAPARIVEKMKDLLARQLTDNDSRLRLAEQKGDLVLSATLTEWTEGRRNSTKYVSETRQVGTREVTDKNGKKKTEPVYEYGRNRPSVVITGIPAFALKCADAAAVRRWPTKVCATRFPRNISRTRIRQLATRSRIR
jgi:hypothetical protein